MDASAHGRREVILGFAALVGRAFVLAVALGLLLTAAGIALGAPPADDPAQQEPIRPEQATSGSFLMRRAMADPWAPAPMLETSVRFSVAGVVARATVAQRFQNATDAWVEGVYVFPLPELAAVDHLRMRVGERVIEGQIREREQARSEFKRAAAEGRRASLVEQQRPNVFTSRVANLGPGEVLVVEIEFQQLLAFDAGEVRLRFPLVVAPRYIPGRPRPTPDDGTSWAPDSDRVPDASQITPPVRPPSESLHNPVTIEVALDAGFPIGSVVSRYHEVVSEARDEARRLVRLRDARVPADRDFELAWTPRAGTLPQSAAFVEEKDGARFALVTLFPPVGSAAAESRLPRETVYVIDTSGSMHGLSIQQARRALLFALDRLRPGDRFNLIQFNSQPQALFAGPRPAEGRSLAEARAWVEGLSAQGGTEMRRALEAALTGSDDPRLVRQVVFLTDGAVGNEAELFRVIRERLGDTRLFTVGIGSAPNGHFMTKAAQFGHGTFTYVGDVREVEAKMGELFARLDSPVLTGIEVEWPDGAAVEAWPQRVPDLYLSEPVVLSARLTGPADSVVVRGLRGGQEWSEWLSLAGRPGPGLGVLWARRKIEALSDSLSEGANPEAVRAAVVELGLAHHLVTKHTSLVAVDVTPARPQGEALERQAVATNLPHGWSYGAVFGTLPQTATGAPGHAALALLALLFAAALRLADRRFRRGARS